MKDVYWAEQGRASVDPTVGVVVAAAAGGGGLAVAGAPLWPKIAGELRR